MSKDVDQQRKQKEKEKQLSQLKEKILKSCELFVQNSGKIESGFHLDGNKACAIETFRTIETKDKTYIDLGKQHLGLKSEYCIDFVAGFDRALINKEKDSRELSPSDTLKGDDYYILGQDVAFELIRLNIIS